MVFYYVSPEQFGVNGGVVGHNVSWIVYILLWLFGIILCLLLGFYFGDILDSRYNQINNERMCWN